MQHQGQYRDLHVELVHWIIRQRALGQFSNQVILEEHDHKIIRLAPSDNPLGQFEVQV